MSEGIEKTVETKGPAKAKTPSVDEEAIRRGVENWVATHLRNTPFSRHTEAWNIFQKALPALPGAIAKEIK